MRKIMLLCMLTGLLSSCIIADIFDNGSNSPRVMNADRDYILVNKTPHYSLQVYASGQVLCSSFKLIAVLDPQGRYPYHVLPGQTIYINYCTVNDKPCTGCRLIKIIGNNERQSNEVSLN